MRIDYEKLTIKPKVFGTIFGLCSLAMFFLIVSFLWIPIGIYIKNFLPSFLSLFYAVATLFAFGVLVKIFSLFVTMFFVKDKMNKLRSMNETLSYLLLSSLAGAAFTAFQSFFSLELFLNDEPYNPDNMISVALFSLGNYFVENSYFYYLLGAFLFFRFYLLRNKIVLELETKETTETTFSEKEKFYLSLLACVILIFVTIGAFFMLFWFLVLLINK
ncbi:hypothetical protein WNA44_001679 [Campylobacter coli]|uniref:hypothetical protein n=1 Tax=Campylobacter coli TaxID=195 RepID=UPI000E13A66E|nr:hypothetical protein [Campylobacter coli]EAM0732388.1 hypothetical protein [Campylobacter coli]EJL6092365.1 hypothetical protein [Campylobacter coli]EKL2721179.1 hypothetical protein [Campylobacter coli]EKM9857842.1 hypothetical protein [Campylobacter coli]EKO0383519.1 hypothetical protein [Campylobacter coli]